MTVRSDRFSSPSQCALGKSLHLREVLTVLLKRLREGLKRFALSCVKLGGRAPLKLTQFHSTVCCCF